MNFERCGLLKYYLFSFCIATGHNKCCRPHLKKKKTFAFRLLFILHVK